MTNSISGMNGTSNSGFGQQVTPAGMQNLGQKDFLRLMVAQIQNQDPLQPQVNGEFLSQLAQFSTNDGINKMQESMQQMAGSLQSNQALQASALVGRKVLVDNNIVELGAENDAKVAMNVPNAMGDMTVFIYSEKNELLKTYPIGKKDAGFCDIAWDGKDQSGNRLPEGKYKIEVRGKYAGSEVALRTMTSANVDSVSLGQYGEGLMLNVAGVGAISLDQIRQITA